MQQRVPPPDAGTLSPHGAAAATEPWQEEEHDAQLAGADQAAAAGQQPEAGARSAGASTPASAHSPAETSATASATKHGAGGAGSRGISAGSLLRRAVPPALAVSAVAAVVRQLLAWRGRAKAGSTAPEPEPEEPEPSLLPWVEHSVALERHSSTVSTPRGALPLQQLRIAVAETIPLQGVALSCGVPGLQWEAADASAAPPAAAGGESAPVADRLLQLGATIVGQASCQAFSSVGTPGDNLRNPGARFRCAGGGCSGAAAVVATGQADASVAPDYLGAARIPAASQGLYCLSITPGAVGACLPAPGGEAGPVCPGGGGGAAGRRGGVGHVGTGGLHSPCVLTHATRVLGPMGLSPCAGLARCRCRGGGAP